jgi:hypothetical protein
MILLLSLSWFIVKHKDRDHMLDEKKGSDGWSSYLTLPSCMSFLVRKSRLDVYLNKFTLKMLVVFVFLFFFVYLWLYKVCK